MNKLITIILLAVLMIPVACNDDILTQDNPTELSQDTFFKTQQQANSALYGVYAGLQGRDMYARQFFYTLDMTTDEMDGTGNLQGELRQMLEFTFDASTGGVAAMWRGCFRGIQRANNVIANVTVENTEDPQLKEAEINRIVAEAKFLRAWYYFQLGKLYGGVPLLTVPAEGTVSAARSSADEVFAQIIKDLTEAQAALPLKSEYDADNIWRASKGAAQGLLARVQMFRKDYGAANTELDKIIGSAEYSLTDRYRDNFEDETENNSESLFEIQLTNALGGGGIWGLDGQGLSEGTFRGIEYGFKNFFNIIPSAPLLAEYEVDDPRFKDNFYSEGDLFNNGADTVHLSGVTQVWSKYQRYYKTNNDGFDYSGINFRVLRYADILLMKAECENELSGPAAALPFINQIRNRASVAMPEYGTPEMDALYPVGTAAEMLKAIQHERVVELCGEQVRRGDLIRWGIAKEKVEAAGRNYTSPKHDLFPIPLDELDANDLISQDDQNPGY